MNAALNLGPLIGVTLGVYVLVIFGLAYFAQGKISGAEDFLVAGRRLPLSLAWATLLATWFGAGTLLTSADEVRSEGVRAAALEPFGAGACLIIAGLFFAAPLWRMNLLTLADFFRLRFGRRAEVIAALAMIPSYFGWTAAQFLALANMLELFMGLDPAWGVLVVAVVGTGYTVMGGMWSVTLTDALQVGLLLLGLLVLGAVCLTQAPLDEVATKTDAEMLVVIPTESYEKFMGWLGVFVVAALGNLPGQELMQRVFSSKSATVARNACLLAGAAYLIFGLVPVYLALASRLLLPDYDGSSSLPALASIFLSPPLAVIFTVMLASAVLSTIDSSMLAPSSLMAQNVVPASVRRRVSPLALNRLALLLSAGISLSLAYGSQSAYELLEESYSMGLVGLLVPLSMGLWRTPRSEMSSIVSTVVGSTVWLVHLGMGWELFLEPWLAAAALPNALTCAFLALIAYLIVDRGGAAGSALGGDHLQSPTSPTDAAASATSSGHGNSAEALQA